jgi:hypothetical protein
MPGLVPGIHVLGPATKDVDGRDRPGHDGRRTCSIIKRGIRVTDIARAFMAGTSAMKQSFVASPGHVGFGISNSHELSPH